MEHFSSAGLQTGGGRGVTPLLSSSAAKFPNTASIFLPTHQRQDRNDMKEANKQCINKHQEQCSSAKEDTLAQSSKRMSVLAKPFQPSFCSPVADNPTPLAWTSPYAERVWLCQQPLTCLCLPKPFFLDKEGESDVLEGKDLLSPLFRRLFCENQTWLSAVERLTRDHYCCSSLGYHQKHVIDAKFMCWSLDLHHCNSDNRARTAHAEKTMKQHLRKDSSPSVHPDLYPSLSVIVDDSYHVFCALQWMEMQLTMFSTCLEPCGRFLYTAYVPGTSVAPPLWVRLQSSRLYNPSVLREQGRDSLWEKEEKDHSAEDPFFRMVRSSSTKAAVVQQLWMDEEDWESLAKVEIVEEEEEEEADEDHEQMEECCKAFELHLMNARKRNEAVTMQHHHHHQDAFVISTDHSWNDLLHDETVIVSTFSPCVDHDLWIRSLKSSGSIAILEGDGLGCNFSSRVSEALAFETLRLMMEKEEALELLFTEDSLPFLPVCMNGIPRIDFVASLRGDKSKGLDMLAHSMMLFAASLHDYLQVLVQGSSDRIGVSVTRAVVYEAVGKHDVKLCAPSLSRIRALLRRKMEGLVVCHSNLDESAKFAIGVIFVYCDSINSCLRLRHMCDHIIRDLWHNGEGEFRLRVVAIVPQLRHVQQSILFRA